MSNIQTDNLNQTVPLLDPKKAVLTNAPTQRSVPIRKQMLRFPIDTVPFMNMTPDVQEVPQIRVLTYSNRLNPLATAYQDIWRLKVNWSTVKDLVNLDPYYVENHNYINFVLNIDIIIQSNPFFVTSLIASFNSDRNFDFTSSTPANTQLQNMYNNGAFALHQPFDIIEAYRDDYRSYSIPSVIPMQAIRNLNPDGSDDSTRQDDYVIGNFDLRYFTSVRTRDPTTVSPASIEIYLSAMVVYGAPNFSSTYG